MPENVQPGLIEADHSSFTFLGSHLLLRCREAQHEFTENAVLFECERDVGGTFFATSAALNSPSNSKISAPRTSTNVSCRVSAQLAIEMKKDRRKRAIEIGKNRKQQSHVYCRRITSECIAAINLTAHYLSIGWLNKRLIDIIAESRRVRSFIRSFAILHCYRNRFSSAEGRKSACHSLVAAGYAVTHAARSHIRQVPGQTHRLMCRICDSIAHSERETNFPSIETEKGERAR